LACEDLLQTLIWKLKPEKYLATVQFWKKNVSINANPHMATYEIKTQYIFTAAIKI
jgi:hypothetical protein